MNITIQQNALAETFQYKNRLKFKTTKCKSLVAEAATRGVP